MKTTRIAAGLTLMAGVCASASSAPQTEISNGLIRARLYLPDAATGFYRGTRFDWSGVIADLVYAGHNYFPQWFQRADPKVRDFIYDGADIVAGPCTAITGPVEEFSTDNKALGYDDAKPGGTFIKIGVGALRKPDNRVYETYRLYEIVDGGKWTVGQHPDSVEFTHELTDSSSGYGYVYGKTVSLGKDKPELLLEHRLRNTGTRAIRTSVYDHNFLYIDQLPPSEDVSITVPFPIKPLHAFEQSLAEIRGNCIAFKKTLTGEDRVYFGIEGFGSNASDYDIRIENRKAGAGLRITADRPMARAALWTIRAPLSLEPFIDMRIEPGAEFTWRIRYQFYTAPRTGN